jgi:hypothetical protein
MRDLPLLPGAGPQKPVEYVTRSVSNVTPVSAGRLVRVASKDNCLDAR